MSFFNLVFFSNKRQWYTSYLRILTVSYRGTFVHALTLYPHRSLYSRKTFSQLYLGGVFTVATRSTPPYFFFSEAPCFFFSEVPIRSTFNRRSRSSDIRLASTL